MSNNCFLADFLIFFFFSRRKCFVSQYFLNLHISNSSTMCELCNTQCCTAVNLRNHRNLECDLAKRKRNIDLIAQETALLGTKIVFLLRTGDRTGYRRFFGRSCA